MVVKMRKYTLFPGP